MEPDDTVTALPELIVCPQPGCGVPAEVEGWFTLPSTAGPVGHARTWCLAGHGFTVLAETLAAWPTERDRRPLGAGG
jgi:hypothetical protein